MLSFISSEYPKATLLGTDFSESKITYCKKVYPNIDFKVHNIYESLEFKYDRILCTEVLEHLLDPKKALLKLMEGLKPNGRLFITVPNGRLDTFNGHINFWSIESWNAFLEENVTDDCKIEASLFFQDRLIYTIITRL